MDNIKNKLEEQIKEAESKLRLLAEFPDLHEQSDRWKNIRLISKKANALCTNVDIHATCGCCAEAIIDAYPYVLREGHKVYAEGSPIVVGRKSNWVRCQWGDWKSRLQQHGIGEQAIKEIEEIISKWPEGFDDFSDIYTDDTYTTSVEAKGISQIELDDSDVSNI